MKLCDHASVLNQLIWNMLSLSKSSVHWMWWFEFWNTNCGNKCWHKTKGTTTITLTKPEIDEWMVGIAWTIKRWIISTTQTTNSYPKSLEGKTITYDFGIISPVLGQAQQE